MSWRDFTLCSHPDLWEQWRRETVFWMIQLRFYFWLRIWAGTGLGGDWLISLQTPLKEKVLDEVDNINGRELDLRIFNSRLPVVWAQLPSRLKGLQWDLPSFVSVCKACTHVGVGYDVPTRLPAPLLLLSWQQGMETYETRAGRQRSSGHRKCPERTVGALNPPDVGVFCLKPEECFGLALMSGFVLGELPSWKTGKLSTLPLVWRSWYGREMHKEEGGKASRT